MKMRYRKVFSIILAIAAVCLLAGGAVASAVPENVIPRAPITFGSVAAGSPNATYAAVWSDLMMKSIPGLTVSLEVGSMAQNMQNIHVGTVDIGQSATLIVYPGYYGQEWAEGTAYNNVRAFSPTCKYEGMFITKASSGINNITDLEDKIVAVGSVGSGSDTTGRQLMDFFGIKPKQLVNGTWTDIGMMLSDDMVDAVFYLAGHPVAFLQENELSQEMNYFELTEDQFTKFIDAYPYYVTATIPAGTYKHLTKDYKCLTGWNMLICSPNLSEDFVYYMVKTFYENLDVIHAAHPTFVQTAPENVKFCNIPLHPGAERYFKEIGAELPILPPPPAK